jgi:LacI family transcriptional regulator, galactose operon repressor
MTAPKPPGRRRPTQADVARQAGVSQALVSYVLNRSPVTLPEATRRRVLDAMDELGYVPHSAARALRLDRTMTLALVIPDITNPYYPAVERGLQDSAEAGGYQLITYNTDGVAAKERKALRSVRETRADGAVIYDFHLGPDDYRTLLDAGTALAMVVSTPGKVGDLPIDRLTVDVAGGVARIARYLIERGYAPLGTIAGALDSEIGQVRFQAFQATCAAAGVDVLPEHVVEADFTYEGGRDAMAALLQAGHPPRAIFAANDLMALGALEACLAAGLQVPGDIAIAGFDDIEASRMVTPAITTVVQPGRWMGQEVGRLLVDRLTAAQDAPVRDIGVTLELVIRDSA